MILVNHFKVADPPCSFNTLRYQWDKVVCFLLIFGTFSHKFSSCCRPCCSSWSWGWWPTTRWHFYWTERAVSRVLMLSSDWFWILWRVAHWRKSGISTVISAPIDIGSVLFFTTWSALVRKSLGRLRTFLGWVSNCLMMLIKLWFTALWYLNIDWFDRLVEHWSGH